jgi:transaldolase
MKIFLDTANLEEIRRGAALGVLDGITINPILAAREKRPFRELVLEAGRILRGGVVNAEVVSTETEGMLREGRELASWHASIVVTVPMLPAGIRAVRLLREEGIRTNVALIFSPMQALLAAKAGAYFVSPFLGQLDDASQDGLELLRDIVGIYRNYRFETRVLAASLHHPAHVLEAARIGADIAAMHYHVFEQLFRHPLTDHGLETFLKDWEKARESLGEIPGAAAPRSGR